MPSRPAGKSTISALLCKGAGPAVHAHHFLKYSDSRRLDPIRIVKSLAFQLALRYARTRAPIMALASLVWEHWDVWVVVWIFV